MCLYCCSLDISSENVTFSLSKSNFKMALIWKKKSYFRSTLVTRERHNFKVPSGHISLTNIHAFCSPYCCFFVFPICKNCEIIMYGFSLERLLVWILIRVILEQSVLTNWWAKFKLRCLLLIFIYTNAKYMVICKPRTLNDGRWRLSYCFLSSAVLLFIGKINDLCESFWSSFLLCNIRRA